ncbi:DUF2087 domain-containing protein [Yoonia sp. R2-816]|uniref:DUF2087 domain-containing protein n=1 Tax=Yoonia sp. R2-816 TaxID=3342638 RepID=UPI00372C1AD4
MPREIQTITIPDLSTFTKALRTRLQRHDGLPTHASMLSMVAQAAGYDNFQHLKASKPTACKPTDSKRLEKALRVFDQGIMTRWPKQTAVQGLCLWAFWAALPARRDMTEKEVNALLKSRHSFGDHALLRRSLIDHRLVQRTIDGKTYRRIEQAPPEDARALIAAI